MKKLLLVLVFPILTGCSLFKNSTPIITEKSVNIPVEALKSCDLLATTQVSTVDEVLLENIELYKMYAVCARKQDDSVKLIKKFANIKE